MTVADRIALAVVIVIWGLHYVIAKAALDQFPPLFMIVLRLMIVAILLAPFLFRRRPPLKALAGMALSLGVFHYGLLYGGLAGIDAGPAAIAGQLSVPFSVLLAALVFRERLSAFQGVGMAAAFAGVWLIAGEPRTAPGLGSLAAVIASSVAWAIASVQIRRLGPINGFVFNAWVALIALPFVLAASVLLESGQIEAVRAADWRGWTAVLYSSIAVSVFSWTLWYRLLAKYGVGRVVPMNLLCPVLAVGFAILMRGEPLTWEIAVGSLITVAGVAAIHFASHRMRAAGRSEEQRA